MRHALLVLCISGLAAQAAFAAEYPERAVRIIVPFSPGGPIDLTARVVAQKLAESYRQPFVVDNRGGANGNIATDLAARAAADGYTLLMGATGPLTINPTLYAKSPIDPIKDFAPIVLVRPSYYLMVVHPSVPAGSVAEFVQLARSGKFKIVHASSGIGSPGHLAGEMLKRAANIDFVHVSYKGGGPSLAAVASGESNLVFIEMALAAPLIRNDRVKVLAIAAPKRSPDLPNTPTLTEAGFPAVDPRAWAALFAPAGTPRAIIVKLNREVRRILALPEVQKAFENDASDFGVNTPEYVAAFVKTEIAKWKKVILSSGARAD